MLNNKGLKIIGVDKSKDMVSKSIQKFPSLSKKVIQGDVLQSYLFHPYSFTHVLCLYFTIYYIQNKSLFMENVYDWLKPGGYFILHLVNRDNFSPLLPMNSYQRRKKNGKKSKIQFVDFDYESNFELYKNTNKGIFTERFKGHNGNIRKQTHRFYMEQQTTILSMAQKIGFIVEQKIDMEKIEYNYQYLYILTKPN
jgi:SAM-dependent methyltransferase